MIKIGILGCGFMGGMHAASYRALTDLGVKITAVASANAADEKFAKEFGAAFYSDASELIAQADTDVIDICLPTFLHTKFAVEAMRKGKAVFIEKPVCITDEDMELLLRTQQETGVPVQVGQVVRMFPEYRWLKETVAGKTYGDFCCGSFHRFCSKPNWANNDWLNQPEYSGGSCIDLHVHDIDFVRYLLGDPDRIQTRGYRDESGYIREMYTLYGYGDHVSVEIEGGWDYPADFPFDAGFRVKLEKAAVTLKDGKLTVYPFDGTAFTPELQEECVAENDIGGNISSLTGYYDELKYFVEGLKGIHPLEIATLPDAIQSVRLAKKGVELTGGFRLETPSK